MGKFLLTLVAFAYQKSGNSPPRGRRAFQKEIWIPPLATTTTPTSNNNNNNNNGDSIPVLYTNDPMAAQRWAERHFLHPDGPGAIGWDMESSQVLPWRKALYEGPATVQISVVDAALVLQIAQEGSGPHLDTIPFLSEVLADSSILKVGVGLDQDMIELIRWPKDHEGSVLWTDEIVGRLDIGGIGGRYGSTMSLKSLARTICGVDLPKDKRLSFSNWAQSPRLSSQQIAYAARDAWVSAVVLEELSQRDPEQFSKKALMERVRKEELSIYELDEKAKARREAKTKLLSILGKGDTRVERKDLTSEQLETVVELEKQMKDLAPPHPILFDVENLGL